jgi:hypothetical protein
VLTIFQPYEFVFMSHLMQTVLGFTIGLNHALQKNDQDIVNAVELKLQCFNCVRMLGGRISLKNCTHFVSRIKSKFPIWTHSVGQ